MSKKKPDTIWSVRGMALGQDVCLVIEAATDVAAELFATKRGVDVVVVTQATFAEIAAARGSGRLWRYTPESRLRCFGRPVGALQAACLMLCGLATLALDLHARHIPIRWLHL